MMPIRVHRFDPEDRRIAVLLSFALILSFGSITRADAPDTGRKARAVNGTVQTENGIRVMRLWGTPFEQGYAHGYLLGGDIVLFTQGILLDPKIMPDQRVYESLVRGKLVPSFRLSADERDELQGMLAGINDKLPAEQRTLHGLDRAIDEKDLIALNTMADWSPSACTSFAAWGSQTADGEMIVARNLDYMDLPGLKTSQFIIARVDQPAGRKRWVSVACPGIIGAYTGMSEDGVVVAMHDVPAMKLMGTSDLTPRSLVLRRIVETVSAAEAVPEAEEILKVCRAFRGNNFLVAAKYTGQKVPAAVFEYDGDVQHDEGVTLRAADFPANKTPADTIVCSNHYRARSEPSSVCSRYEAVRAALALHSSDAPMTAAFAWNTIRLAAVPGTIHIFIARPNHDEFWLALANADTSADKTERKLFHLSELFAKPVSASAGR